MSWQYPPDDVLTELGRVTYSSIVLGAVRGGVQRRQPSSPWDRSAASLKHGEGRSMDLRSWLTSEDQDLVIAWLTNALDVMEHRNALLLRRRGWRGNTAAGASQLRSVTRLA